MLGSWRSGSWGLLTRRRMLRILSRVSSHSDCFPPRTQDPRGNANGTERMSRVRERAWKGRRKEALLGVLSESVRRSKRARQQDSMTAINTNKNNKNNKHTQTASTTRRKRAGEQAYVRVGARDDAGAGVDVEHARLAEHRADRDQELARRRRQKSDLSVTTDT
eukprot:391727-Rhodomonas_salina.1